MLNPAEWQQIKRNTEGVGNWTIVQAMEHTWLNRKISTLNQACPECFESRPVINTDTEINIPGCPASLFAENMRQDQITRQCPANEILDTEFVRDRIHPAQDVEQQGVNRPVRPCADSV